MSLSVRRALLSHLSLPIANDMYCERALRLCLKSLTWRGLRAFGAQRVQLRLFGQSECALKAFCEVFLAALASKQCKTKLQDKSG
jgi:hypothetical protein